MSKVIFAPTISYMSGKIGSGVYMVTAKSGMSYMRNYVYPKLTDLNHAKGKAMANFANLWKNEMSAAYREDIEQYAVEYHALSNYGNPRSDRAYSPFAIFVKLLYKLCETDPVHIDMSTVTLSDLNTVLPGNDTLQGAANNGFLPLTPNCDNYTHTWL